MTQSEGHARSRGRPRGCKTRVLWVTMDELDRAREILGKPDLASGQQPKVAIRVTAEDIKKIWGMI